MFTGRPVSKGHTDYISAASFALLSLYIDETTLFSTADWYAVLILSIEIK